MSDGLWSQQAQQLLLVAGDRTRAVRLDVRDARRVDAAVAERVAGVVRLVDARREGDPLVLVPIAVDARAWDECGVR